LTVGQGREAAEATETAVARVGVERGEGIIFHPTKRSYLVRKNKVYDLLLLDINRLYDLND